MIYVIMNKYNNTFYKEHYAANMNVWTMNIDKAKIFSTPADTYNHAYLNDILRNDIIVVDKFN